MVQLEEARELTSARLSDITAEAMSRKIVVAGGSKCGKTTLIAGIYDRFVAGPFAGYQFSRSSTLHAFEARLQWSRTTANLREPDMERTKRWDFDKFLHLRVGRTGTHDRRDLIFTDWPGETFEHARDSADYCKGIPFVGDADHFVLLVDGRKLADPVTRHQEQADANMVLHNLRTTGKLGAGSLVEVVASKWDFVLRAPDVEDILQYWSEFQEVFGRMHGELGRMTFSRLAVGAVPRPEEAEEPIDLELDLPNLFTRLVQDWPAAVLGGEYLKASRPPTRQFDAGRPVD